MYSYYDGSNSRAAVKLPWRMLRLGDLIRPTVFGGVKSARKCVDAANGHITFSDRHAPASHQRSLMAYTPYHFDISGLPAEEWRAPRSPLRLVSSPGSNHTKGSTMCWMRLRRLKRLGLSFEVHIWGPVNKKRTRRCGDRYARVGGPRLPARDV
jgi:hypothetical protein